MDLRDADLRRADLRLADLTGADLRGARLCWADLAGCSLQSADLRNADLEGADLTGADLREADLRGAWLSDVTWNGARVAAVRGLPGAVSHTAGVAHGPARNGTEPALAIFDQGIAAHRAGDLASAERALRLVASMAPDAGVAPYALAALALDRDDPEQAQGWLAAAVAADTDADRALLELSELHVLLGNESEATRVLTSRPRWAHLARDLGALCAHNRERLGPTALGAWQSRRSQAPEFAPVAAQSALERALQAGDVDGAERELRSQTRDAALWAVWSLVRPKLDATAAAIPGALARRWPQAAVVAPIGWQGLGAHSLTARVRTDAGVVFAQRFSGLLRPLATLEWTHALQQQLGLAGLHVPGWLEDGQGNPVTAIDDDWLVLAGALDGSRPRAMDVAECARMGRQLAQIHQQAAPGSARPAGGLRAGMEILGGPDPAVTWLETVHAQPALARILATQPAPERVAALLRLTRQQLGDALADCPRGLCHGDYAASNLVAMEGGQLGVLDWDLADVQPLVWDLARALDRLGRDRHGLVRQPQALAFLRAYHAERPLLRAERRCLPVLIPASRVDLDTGVLALLGPLDPDTVPVVLAGLETRLQQAASGAPEWTDVLARL